MGVAGVYHGNKRYFIKFPKISSDAEIEIFSTADSFGYPSNKYSASRLSNKFLTDEFGHQYYNLNTFISWKYDNHRSKDKGHLRLLLKGVISFSKITEGKRLLALLGYKNAGTIKKLIALLKRVIAHW